MNYSSLDNFCISHNIDFRINEEMKRHTSFKIGGLSNRFLVVDTIDKAVELYCFFKKENIEFFIIGKGSNLLVSDNGIKIPVISLEGEFKAIKLIEEDIIYSGAGVSLSSLCAFAKENSLKGLEFAYGIPGTVGGAIYMNAGAYGGEMVDVLEKVEHVDLNGKGKLEKDNFKFSYRKSNYCKNDCIITGGFFRLVKSNKEEITKNMEEILYKRKSKQPLEYPSAGSVFKRPQGYFAGSLIEECGLKGAMVGGAQVSEKHAGFIINKGNSTAKDVMDLVEKIKQTIKQEKDIELECEIKYIGGE